MKRVCYLSTKSGRVFSKYEKAYNDAIDFRFAVLNEPLSIAREKAVKNIKIVFLLLDK